MANDDLFGLLTGAREAYDGVAKAVADGQDHLAKAVKQAEADANAKRLIKKLQDPIDDQKINQRLSGEAVFLYLKKMSELDKEKNLPLSDFAREQLREMIEKAAHHKNLSNLPDDKKDQVNKMMQEAGRPVVFSTEPPPQFFESLSRASSRSDGRSSSDASSTSGSSRSNQSTTTRGTEESGVSALKALTNQDRKTNGPQNGSLDSPTKLSESKGLKSEQDKKAPTQSRGCATGIRKAFSSCCSYLSNGLSSIIKKFTPDMSKGADLSSEQVREAAPIRVKKQRRKEPKEKKVDYFQSLRNAFTKEREVDLSKYVYDERRGKYVWSVHSTLKLGSASKLVDKVGRMPGKAMKMGVSGMQLAGRGAGALRAGIVGTGKAIYYSGEYVASKYESYDSGKSWADRFESMGRFTEGMGSNSGYGVGAAALDAGAFAYSAVSETPEAIIAVTPGPRAAKFAVYVAGSIAGGGASMVSRLSKVNPSAIVPTAFR